MANTPLNFAVNQLIINDSTFDLQVFESIVSEDLEKIDVTHREDKTVETLHIKKIKKECLEDRFVTIYFLQGAKYPYPDTVINDELKESKNPRDPNEIELDDQFFVLIDKNTQRIYLSDLRKKFVITKWLEDKLEKNISVKAIIAEDEFVNKLKMVNSISFTLTPDLFNSTSEGVLTRTLVQDIFGYGAAKAKLELSYNNVRASDTIKEKIQQLLQRKSEFETITVVGRDDEEFDSVFNLQEIVSKLTVDVNIDGNSKLFEPNDVFTALIGLIK